jgi:glycosyltransferase involved in cell wall biosynthesis
MIDPPVTANIAMASQKLKTICFVLRYHPAVALGGAELQSYSIAKELAQRGWDVHYISERRGDGALVNRQNEITLHWLNERRTGEGVLNSFQLARLLKKIKPDVIYTRTTVDYIGIVGILAKSYGLKYVWASASIMDCKGDNYGRILTTYKNRWTKPLRFLQFYICDRLVSYGIRHCDVAITQSKEQQKLLRDCFHKTSTVISNGLPVTNSPATKPDRVVVLWIGNIKPLKRLDLLLSLSNRCRDLPAEFVVVGHDEKAMTKEMLKNHDNGNVKWLGYLPLGQVEKIMESSHLFVNTSDYEGWPNTFIQAWMRKIPVVSLNVDPDHVIEKHRLGFHSRTFERMVQDVRMLVGDRKLREELGENGRRYALKAHNIEGTVDSLEKSLQPLIDPHYVLTMPSGERDLAR